MNIRFLLSGWKTVRIPGLWLVMRDLFPFLRMHFLFAALETGLLQALQTGSTRETLMAELGVQRPELLDALLDMGLALKELSLENARFCLRGKRSRVLAAPLGNGDALAAIIQANVTYYNASYRHLADRMRGAPLGEDLAEIGEVVARFAEIGEPILKSFIHSLVPSSGPFRVLDVGCGSGFVLKTVRQANPRATGMGIDMDEKVVGQARNNSEKWGLENDFSILSGDIRSRGEALEGGFNLITAFNLIYYLPPDDRPEFFSLLRSLLSSKGRLALVNNFQSKGRDPMAANLNIVNCSLKELTPLPDLKAIETQLSDCGFRCIRVIRFMPKSEFYGITAGA